MAANNQYYTLNLGTIEIKHSRQSCYRRWNRLHRLQKTVVIIIVILFSVYFFTHVEFHHNSIPKIPTHHEHEGARGIVIKPHVNKESPKEVVNPIETIRANKIKKPQRLIFKGATNERQRQVVSAFKHAWDGYKKFAWGRDELLPLSKTSTTWFNLGLTIVDSLDTIYLMNLDDVFKEARDWVSSTLDFNVNRYNNLFEITIRIMGGLLAAYHLSGDEMFLEKAYDLGNRSLPAFNTQSHIPYSDINLNTRSGKPPHWTSDSSISEVATLQLEFKDLSFQTNDLRFKTAVAQVSECIHKLDKTDGLVPIYINTNTGKFMGRTITLGARGDSYYEYLIKQWIQTGAKYDPKNEDFYLLKDWLDSVNGMRKHLIRQTKPNNLTFVGELISESFSAKMDHLVCFLPGNLALGYLFLKDVAEFPREELDGFMSMAKEITETCYQMYAQMATGLSPEIAYFNTYEGSKQDLYVKEADRHNLLRPETVESLFYMYKVTGDKKYQEYGWKIFEAFEKFTKVESGGYTSINDVTNVDNTKPRDKMESFFLAETLKYLFLLFEDEHESISLKHWLINTEAHLLPIYY